MALTVYDSDRVHRPLVNEASNLWRYRGLLRLLITRDLTLRYKRSVMGVWWTLLNPLLTMTVMWIVFGKFLRFGEGVPNYIVYLLSGILLITFFTQAIISAGASIVGSSGVLAKVFVPPEVFSISAVTAAGVNLLISLIPLFVIQLVNGTGIPWTVVLLPIPIVALLGLVAGLGLIVAAAAVYFYDVLDLTAVVIQLIGYLTPTFYPVDVIPQEFLPLIHANPLFSFLVVLRGFVYEGTFAPAWNFAVMFGSAVTSLLLGAWIFSRSWKKLVTML